MVQRKLLGRDRELAVLLDWIREERCALLCVHGVGGVGKTALVADVFLRVKGEFERCVWRTLQGAPSATEFAEDCLLSLGVDARIRDGQSPLMALSKELISHRHLLVIDDFELVIHVSGGDQSDSRPVKEPLDVPPQSFEGFFASLVTPNFSSCVIIVTNERPAGFFQYKHPNSGVRTLELSGFSEVTDVQALLSERQFVAVESVWSELIEQYSGNPLALQLAADVVAELYDGSIAEFLNSEPAVFKDIGSMLKMTLQRLSSAELELAYWLAISFEAISRQRLETLVLSFTPSEITDALSNLRRRSWLLAKKGLFEEPSIVASFLRDNLISAISNELLKCNALLSDRIALLIPGSWDYIRENQERTILRPILSSLRTSIGVRGCEAHLCGLLVRLRSEGRGSGYLPGNIVNLLNGTGFDFRGFDLSCLALRGAVFTSVSLQDVDVSNCDLAEVAFAERIGGIVCAQFSPSGELFVTGSMRGEIQIRDSRTGSLQNTWNAHPKLVWSTVFSQDSKFIVKLWQRRFKNCRF